ncbi:MAG TPA: PfkB family carbohydrate kinase, partial [Tepidiformaceae bacterium]|nr:PfkB family carbohydrate kinase [Tepidiformaceae bacterium]
MRPGIGLLVAAFDQMNVLIIGDAMLDRYLRGSAQRLSQEAPVAIIDLERRVCAAGGAANAAMNAAALGAKATLISVVGEDVEAVALRQLLGEGRVGPAIVTDSSRHTLSKSRVVAGGHVLVRIDEGTQSPVSQETDDALCALITAHWDDADVIVLSDYGYGVCSPAVVSAVARQQIAAPRVLGIDSKRLELFRNLRPSIVKPNYQALALCGESVPSTPGAAGSTATDRAEVIRRLAPSILDRTGATAVAVTLDSDGAVVLDAEG